MQNQSKNKKNIFWLTFLIIIFLLGYLFWANFYGADNKIQIDNNNTEVIVNKQDIEEIQLKLDQLDIDLDDILNELEL